MRCFQEEHPDHVEVHDLLYSRSASRWDLTVSSYRKLRLRPAVVRELLENAGLNAEISPGPRGMLRLVADA